MKLENLEVSTGVDEKMPWPEENKCPPDCVSDGYNCWAKCKRQNCGLEIVRIGKTQCWCDSEGGPDFSTIND